MEKTRKNRPTSRKYKKMDWVELRGVYVSKEAMDLWNSDSVEFREDINSNIDFLIKKRPK